MGRRAGHGTRTAGLSNLRSSTDMHRLPHEHPGSADVMEEKLRMRAWLKKHIEDGSVPGLDWVDEVNNVFRIPWKHGSLKGWSINDVDICKKWAMHTDKYDPHVNDTKRWKANFRCALNSLKDVKRLTNPASYETRGKNAFRIFRFLPEEKRNKRCASVSKRNSTAKSRCKCQTNLKSGERDIRDQGTLDYVRATVAETCTAADSTTPSLSRCNSYQSQPSSVQSESSCNVSSSYQYVSHEEEVITQDSVDSNLSDEDVVDLIDHLSNESNSPRPSPTKSLQECFDVLCIPTPTYFEQPGDYSRTLQEICRSVSFEDNPSSQETPTHGLASYHELRSAQVPETVKAMETADYSNTF